MSAVAPSPSVRPRMGPRSRFRRLLTTTIGLKIITALTGVVLSLFVLGHMAGNLQAFQGPGPLNDYAKLLRREPALLWAVRLGLLAAVVLHVWAFAVLTRKNSQARAVAYRTTTRRESTYASRSMWLTGPLLLAFIVYHILHLTTGTVHPSFEEGQVYHNLIAGLKVVPVAVFYLVALAALALHLWHGVWSMFQSLGVSQPRYRSFGRRFATGFTLVVVLGFAAVPLAVLAGVLK